ncbi:MAG: PH domain-containing protein [Eubacteriales bacterium]
MQPGEKIEYKANLHFFCFVQSFLLLLLVWWFRSLTGCTSHFPGGVLLIFCGVFHPTVIGKNRRFCAVTDKWVILKTGVIGRKALDLVLAKCEGLQIKQSVSGRIFGFGTITVALRGAASGYPFGADPIR